MSGGGLIRNAKFLTHVGQLRSISRTKFGDISTITSITTVKCLVYVEKDGQRQTNPSISNPTMHQLLLPYSERESTKLNDHILQVTDTYGVVVLDAARIARVIDYNHWRYQHRFFHCELDLNLDAVSSS